MGARDEIRTALAAAAKGLTSRQLLSTCRSFGDINELVAVVHKLKGEGKVEADGMRESQVVYKIGKWPVETEAATPAPLAAPPPVNGRGIQGLRSGLFDMLEGLRNGTVDVHKAKAYAALSLTIIKSVEVQIEFERLRIEKQIPNLSDMQLAPALEHKP